jgi:threonine/homoserine/homoserine lactone efflux protein
VLSDLSVLLHGALLGFAIAAPVGPIGLLCVRRTLQHGARIGFATGLGAAVADTFYGAIAAFSVTALIDVLNGYATEFRLVGGIFLLIIAVRAVRAKPAAPARARDVRNLLGAFGTGVVLTLTNPMTIFSFAALLAGFGLGGEITGRIDTATLVAGVFLGSAAWWLLLSGGISLIRRHISDRLFVRLNQSAALALAGFGGYAVLTAVSGVVSHAMS